ncbi:MAG: hypothetical protein F4X03_13340 [Dehalococcoidia bacterium]|nr:hypothetical protein [Dehalococcoidia bacterium]MYD29875.1 hypothetical protein [Dehalococcoidia bacterium]
MAGGVLLSVHVVPVLEGRIVAFVLDPPGPKGRWLPWTVLEQGANPYEIASTIIDEWCDGAMSDLRLADVISREGEDGWELAIVFRAELTALPGHERGAPRICDAQDLAAVQGFEAVDLERWLGGGSAATPATEGDSPKLVF